MSWEEEKHLLNARKTKEFRELVEGGLMFISWGACSLFLTIFLALFLYAYQTGALGAQPGLEEKENIQAFALTAIALVVGIGFLATCVGLWRCLMHTPSFRNARETMFLCVVCFLIGSLLQITAMVLGGFNNYFHLHTHLLNWKSGEALPPAVALQLLGLALYLISFFSFNNHLLILYDGMKHDGRKRLFDLFLIFTSLLTGGLIGAFLSLDQLEQRLDLIVLFLAGALFDFFWFLTRMQAVRAMLVDPDAKEDERESSCVTLENTPKILSGVRRVLRTMDK